MAPRGRSRKKVGQTRMDAAIDALSAMGFRKSDIRCKVNALLKVYDGEWQFIEEGSYQVVIDMIVEEQDAKKQNIEAIEADSDSDGAEASNAHVDAGPANVHDGAESSGARNAAEPTNAHVGAESSGARCAAEPANVHAAAESSCARNGAGPSSSGITTEVPASTWTERETAKHVNATDASCVPQTGGRLEWKDISCMDHDCPEDMGIMTANDEECQDSGIRGRGASGLQGVPGLLPPRRRKPCFGWIGSDEEEDCVFFETEVSQRREMNRIACQKDPKYRWDVRQES